MRKGIPEATGAMLKQWQAQGLKFNWLGSPGGDHLGFDGEIEDYEIVEQPIPEKLLQEPLTELSAKEPTDLSDVMWTTPHPALLTTSLESDPNGLDPHAPGAKLDAGKNRLGLVLGGFARALEEVGKVGTYGAEKYSPNGWKKVEDGSERYEDAMMRHWFARYTTSEREHTTGLLHQAQVVWNALAVLENLIKTLGE